MNAHAELYEVETFGGHASGLLFVLPTYIHGPIPNTMFKQKNKSKIRLEGRKAESFK